MIVKRPFGDPWTIADPGKILAQRGGLPGAHLFDLAAQACRSAAAAGVSVDDRLALALPASWLVNSPAMSRVLSRWATEPQRAVWLALVSVLDGDARVTKNEVEDEEIATALHALGAEDYVVEAVSKVLAILLPDVVPLMPLPARVFLLGEERATLGNGAASFVEMLDWFTAASVTHAAELAAIASEHRTAPLSGPQVLDRLLWFASSGHRHFAAT